MEQEITFNDLGDLIKKVTEYKDSRKRQKTDTDRVQKTPYNVDMEHLVYSISSLKKLNDLIGMDFIKKNIVDQILFYAQGLNTNEMMHTCLTGPPGVGKTTLGKILAEVYCSLGYLSTGSFKLVSRSDLIAGYVGQTALKTIKVLKESIGGVLFIDEAYSLGGNTDESGTGYSKECIDTINKFLSENTEDFILIIAGYREDLDKYFFSMNKGLARRFPWNYDISKYSITNLKDIFVYQVIENKWSLDLELCANNYKTIEDLFNEYSSIFENNGGDTLLLFDKAKICHSRRVFGKKKRFKKVLNITDIRLAAELLKCSKKQPEEPPPFGMYL
uniref:AAA+ ATPase domain-containing protein n=1 Tax=viral metagenome TaxID=1070528 RepID=A0A6C0I9V4_9ZZZZ